MIILYLAMAAGVVALIFALLLTLNVLRQDQGNETVRFIGRAIQDGARAFLVREYTVLAVFVVIVFVVLAVFIDYDVLGREDGGGASGLPSTAIAYLAGAIGSALAGYIGMSIAVRANTRTTVKAMIGLNPALRVAFNSGLGDGHIGRGHRAYRHRRRVLDIPGRQHNRRLRLWRVVHRAVRQGGRGNLHQGRGRGRRPGGQDRAGHSRRRPAQPRDHRR